MLDWNVQFKMADLFSVKAEAAFALKFTIGGRGCVVSFPPRIPAQDQPADG